MPITIEEYRQRDRCDRPTELVRGRVIELEYGTPYHGWICSNFVGMLGRYVVDHKLGRVMSNDSGVVTESDPDTLRGADVAYYSFDRLPPGAFSRDEYLAVVPEFIVEVLSPNDRWSAVFAKVTEYLKAGVTAVCVLDANPASAGATIYRDRRAPESFGPDAELTVPDALPGFRVRVGEFWE
jgi:Uma2 family endonuclease